MVKNHLGKIPNGDKDNNDDDKLKQGKKNKPGGQPGRIGMTLQKVFLIPMRLPKISNLTLVVPCLRSECQVKSKLLHLEALKLNC